MWGSSQGMQESYSDELMEGQDLMDHEGSTVNSTRGSIPASVHAWLIIVLSIAAIWFLGGVVFKGVSI